LESAVHVAAVRDPNDHHDELAVSDHVDHGMVTDPQPHRSRRLAGE
jgi:hypothetical protein